MPRVFINITATRIGTLKMLHETRQAHIASKIEIPSHRLQLLFAASQQSETSKHQTSSSASIRTGPQSWAPKQTRSKDLNKQNRMPPAALTIHSQNAHGYADTAIALLRL
jgi:hypothetical protein